MNKLYTMFKGLALNAMASRTMEADPLQSFMFKVSIPGLPTGVGFQQIGGLSREVEVVEYLENMYQHTHKLPGRESVSEVTFERGMYADDYLQTLYEKVFTDKNVRNTVVIQITDRFGKIRREFKCAEAWFSKYECADLDATSSDVIIETMTMVFEYFL